MPKIQLKEKNRDYKFKEIAMVVRREYPSIATSLPTQSSAEAFQKDEEASKNECDIQADMTYLLINKDSPEKIAYIPQSFADDGWNKCCITGKPIRFVVAPNLPEEERDGDNLDILYEKETLDKWHNDHKNDKVLPPKWPISIPFIRDNFKMDKSRQRDTDKRLKNFINELAQMAYEIQQPFND